MCTYRERRSRARCCCSESVLLKASGGGTHAPATPATPQTPPPALRYTRPPYTTTIYVSWYYYICVVLQQRGRLAKLKASCTCSLRRHILVDSGACPHTRTHHPSIADYICVLVVLYMCPHTTIYTGAGAHTPPPAPDMSSETSNGYGQQVLSFLALLVQKYKY